MPFDPGLADRVAHSVCGVRIAVSVDGRAVNEIGFAIQTHGQVAAFSGQAEVALAARRFDEAARVSGRGMIWGFAGSQCERCTECDDSEG